MKKKNFISTADALAYIIKRIDGTEATIDDNEESGDEGVIGSTTKKLQVKTYCIYDYESNFIMEVPADAPNFSTFFDLLRYLDAKGKIPSVTNDWSPSDQTLQDYKDDIIQIRGILADTAQTQSVLFVHRTDLTPSEGDNEFYDILVVTFGFEWRTGQYSKYVEMNTFSIMDSTDHDELTYVDDFTNSTE